MIDAVATMLDASTMIDAVVTCDIAVQLVLETTLDNETQTDIPRWVDCASQTVTKMDTDSPDSASQTVTKMDTDSPDSASQTVTKMNTDSPDSASQIVTKLDTDALVGIFQKGIFGDVQFVDGSLKVSLTSDAKETLSMQPRRFHKYEEHTQTPDANFADDAAAHRTLGDVIQLLEACNGNLMISYDQTYRPAEDLERERCSWHGAKNMALAIRSKMDQFGQERLKNQTWVLRFP
eukprot:TRINITY_DN18718_c0_g3_i1.p1 TRINITY_DN18718_c0_g3~~TRINITY_DN18718_c0_g3_i1.p1  ORF type:complete len:270 (-),score=47.26 TRINITY_DN18718_c0_g3_i1:186-890(-)